MREPCSESAPRLLFVKGHLPVCVSVADTARTRQLGLSGRSRLSADEGMLFVFPEDGKYAFWMKDMRFSIDIIWLSAAGSIVHITRSVSPDTYPRTFESDTPARYVLELSAGYVGAHDVKIGDIVRL